MGRGINSTPERLFVTGETFEDTVEVRELMNSKTVEEQLLAIDALRQWCFHLEETTEAPEGKRFRDRHHWQNKANRRGHPQAILGATPEYKDLLRRDVHEKVEKTFGHLGRLPTPEVIRYLAWRALE